MKITLQDGTVLENLELNGNNFISSAIIESTVFENNLGDVKIEDDEGNITEYRFMKLIQNMVMDGKSWFILAEQSENDLLRARLKATEDTLLFLMDMNLGGMYNV
jgi:hypothetical protein